MSLKVKKGILPKEYTQLEYVITTGNSYIDTGIIGDQRTKIEGAFTISEKVNAGYVVVGGRAGAGQSAIVFWSMVIALGQGQTRCDFGGFVGGVGEGIVPVLNTKHTFKLESKKWYIDNVLINDCSSQSNFDTYVSMLIGACNTNGSTAFGHKGNIYRTKIWQNGTDLSRDYVPAKRNSDNKVGFYDLQNSNFVTSVSGDDFLEGAEEETPTYGDIHELYKKKASGTGYDYISDMYVKNPEWVLPTEYTQLEYLESSGTQYIDTDVVPDDTTGFRVKMSVTNVTTDTFRFGCRQNSGDTRFIIGTMNSRGYLGFGKALLPREDSSWVITSDVPFVAQLNHYNDRHAYINNVISSTDPIEDLSSVTFTCSLTMFGRNSGGTVSSSPQRVYSCEITRGDTLVRNFVPAKNASNELGMYDLVTDTFFTNAGTGDFTAGAEVPKIFKIYEGGYDVTATGTAPLSVPDARHKACTWEIDGESKQNSLPDGYTRLGYIEAVGAETTARDMYWIDTGVSTTLNTEIETYIKHIFADNRLITPFAVGKSSGIYGWSLSHYSAGPDWAVKGGSSTWVNMGNITSDTDYHIVLNKQGFTLNGTLYTQAVSSYSVSGNMYIMCDIWTSTIKNTTKLQMGEFIMRESGVETFHGIPAKNSSNVVGMYDTVSGTFKTNGGTGTFTAGEAIPSPTTPLEVKSVGVSRVPEGYTELEYIHTEGNAWINTGLSLTSFLNKTDSRIVMKIAWTNITQGIYQVNGWGNNPQIGIQPARTASGNAYWQNYNTGTEPITQGEIYTATLDFAGDVGTLKVDGFADLRSVSTTQSTSTFLIGGFTGAGNLPYENIYEVWIYQDGLIRHYIPCKNGSNVVGMYDTVAKTFHSSASTNAFTAGADACKIPIVVSASAVRVPPEYQEVEYCNVAGTSSAYINTDYTPTAGSVVEIYTKMSFLSLSSNKLSLLGYSQYNSGLSAYAGIGISERNDTEHFGINYGNNKIDTGVARDLEVHEFAVNTPTGTYIDGNLVSTEFMGTALVGEPLPIAMFGRKNGGAGTILCRGSIYYLRVVEDGVVKLDLVPVKKLSNNEYGYYDLVSGVFKGKAYSDPISGGSAVTPIVTTTYNVATDAPLRKVGTYMDKVESDGTLTRRVGMRILDGTETWTSSSTYTGSCYTSMQGYDLVDRAMITCTHFIGNAGTTGYSIGKAIINNFDLSLWLSSSTTPTDFKSWLATQYANGTPVIVYFPLATETESTITVPTITLHKGDNTIDVQTEVKPSNMTIGYRKRTKQ